MRTLNSYSVCFQSLQHGDDEESFQYLDQPSVVPANLLCLVKGALALGVQAAEVFLYVGNVALEIRTEQIGIFSNVFGPLRQEGPFRHIVVVFNARPEPVTHTLRGLPELELQPHPHQPSRMAGTANGGVLQVPARSVAVFIGATP